MGANIVILGKITLDLALAKCEQKNFIWSETKNAINHSFLKLWRWNFNTQQTVSLCMFWQTHFINYAPRNYLAHISLIVPGAWCIKVEWKMEKFSQIFGSLVFFLIHKTKMNCAKNFYSEETRSDPRSFHYCGHFYYMNIAQKCSKNLIFGKTAFSG